MLLFAVGAVARLAPTGTQPQPGIEDDVDAAATPVAFCLPPS